MDQLKQDMADLKSDFKEVKTALIGNKEMGSKGIIHYVRENKDYIDNDKKFKQKAIGIIAGFQAAVGAIAAYFAYR